MARQLSLGSVRSSILLAILLAMAFAWPLVAVHSAPPVVLESVFPAGVSAGRSTDVTLSLTGASDAQQMRGNAPLSFAPLSPRTFRVETPLDTRPGIYDLQTFGANGISSTRAFFVTHRAHVVEEPESDDQIVEIGSVISGRIDESGDVDQFRFSARRGQRVILEGWARRIDSPLRAVIELRDARGKLLVANRGFFGVDPLICHTVPADGEYVVRISDLVFAGSSNHVYRLDVHAGPRVVFAIPAAMQRGEQQSVRLFGWNLSEESSTPSGVGPGDYESRTVALQAPPAASHPAGYQLPAAATVPMFPVWLPELDHTVPIGLADTPVAVERPEKSFEHPQLLEVPSEVNGQLVEGGETDWYAFDVRRGEVLYFEVVAARMGSPIDADLTVWETRRERQLAEFHDTVVDLAAGHFPSSHLDPTGRWVVPSDGRYWVAIRNLTGGATRDPRRWYRLSVRREDPAMTLVAIADGSKSPAGIQVARGGRTPIDVLAWRHRGLEGSIRVAPQHLPRGVTCAPVWLGPGVNRATLVLTAADDAPEGWGTMSLLAEATAAGREVEVPVQGGTIVRTGGPLGDARLMADMPTGVAGRPLMRVIANGGAPRRHHLYGALTVRHSPGGVVDVAVEVEPIGGDIEGPVKLTAVGIPETIVNCRTELSPEKRTGYASFYLPPALRPGHYSFAIRAEASIRPTGSKPQTAVAYSEVVSIDVQPAAFRLAVEPTAPRAIRRGEIVQVPYRATRVNGFIGKIHTELATPGHVTEVGALRARGVTFVGQTETGTIQIIANEDAPLGRVPFLRLYGVGSREDVPVFHGSCFLDLEIVP